METLSTLFQSALEFIAYNVFGPFIFLIHDMRNDAQLIVNVYLWLAGLLFLLWFVNYRPVLKLQRWFRRRRFDRKLKSYILSR